MIKETHDTSAHSNCQKKKKDASWHSWIGFRIGSLVLEKSFFPIFSWRCFSKEKNSDAAIESLFTTLKKFLPFFYFLQKSQFSFRRTQKSRKRVVACNSFSWKDVGWIEFRFAMSKIFLQTCVDTFANTFVQSFKSARPKWANMGSFELRLFSLKCGALEHSTIAPPILCKNNCAGFESCCLSFSFAKFNWFFFLSAKSRLGKMLWYP